MEHKCTCGDDYDDDMESLQSASRQMQPTRERAMVLTC